MAPIEKIQISKLELDRKNPWLSEFGVNERSTRKDILEILWDQMAVNELMYSIVSIGQLLEWLYGSKRNNTQPIIRSQNPDLKHLDEVLQSREATVALTQGKELSYAHELSRASDALFEENLVIAKSSLQKARAYLTTGYKGEESLLKTAGSVANLADDLYEEMEKVNREKYSEPKKVRLTD